jgi:hypothetical protein
MMPALFDNDATIKYIQRARLREAEHERMLQQVRQRQPPDQPNALRYAMIALDGAILSRLRSATRRSGSLLRPVRS